MRKIIDADIHTVTQRIKEEEAEYKEALAAASDQRRCLVCWGRCEQLEALVEQRTISESDALQNEAENLLAKARNAKTAQELEALLPAINDMICSLQENREI